LYGQDKLDIDGAMGASIEFGPNVASDADAKRLATVRAQEQHARQTRYEGESAVMRLSAGATFELDDAGDSVRELLVTEVEHRAELTAMTSGGTGDEIDYRNRFAAIDRQRTFRPPRLTPKPRIHGVMSGVVCSTQHATGDTMPHPPLAAIDGTGRYFVELHLDTPGRDASHQGGSEGEYGGVLASLPIRMAQPSVGRDYGMHMPLRAGTEVAVAFVAGDPDRPIIVGALPNATTPSVVGGKDSNLSRIKTQTGVIIQFGDA
jgi:type VI secretion system secreted protein VgrG